MLKSRRDLLDVILQAACTAVEDAGTHNLKPADLPLLNEQWTQSYVGLAVNDCLRKRYSDRKNTAYVTFETSVSWLEEFCGVEGRSGRPPGALTKRQRFDVVAWSKGGNPIGLIEIKDQPVISSYGQTADPKKLRGALFRWPSLKWAVFLLSVRAARADTSLKVEQELSKKSERVARQVQRLFGDVYVGYRSQSVSRRNARIQWVAILLQAPS